VDPDDDSICRWVVWHYRYDPDRSERRNVVVAAFDNRHEFDADIEKRAARLRACKERGEDVDPAEHISGLMQEPGYASRTWTCPPVSGLSEPSVFLDDVGPQRRGGRGLCADQVGAQSREVSVRL
jgi:hypothetical protein